MATQIRSCPLSRLTIGSASDFHTNVLAAITATTPTVLHIETLEPNYKQLVEQLASVVNRQRSYVSTKKLNELDDLRDNGSGFIFNVLDANKTCLIAAKVDAANRLLAQISAYRGMRNHEYSKQSAELRGMLAVLEAAENAADVETLGIGPDIEALREVADEFVAAFKAKAAEASAHADQSDLDSKELASDAAKAYENIVQIVNAYAIVQPTDELLGFIKRSMPRSPTAPPRVARRPSLRPARIPAVRAPVATVAERRKTFEPHSWAKFRGARSRAPLRFSIQ